MIIEKIKKQVQKNPNKIAFINEKCQLTYLELWDRAVSLSDEFAKNSAPVIIYGDKNENVIVSILASLISRNLYVPVDSTIPNYRLNNIKKILDNFWFVDASSDTFEIESPGSILDTKKNIAYVIFTSGTSGEPKGVPISYDNLLNFVDWITNIEGFDKYLGKDNVNVLNQASFSFDLSVTDLFFSLCNGHTLVALSNSLKSDYKKMIEYIIEKRISIMVVTPTFFKYCMTDMSFCSELLPTLKTIYFCGELLEVSLVKKIYDRFPEIDIINAYGPTEATSAVSSVLIDKDMLNEEFLPVGILDKSAVEIILEDHEIVLKGKSVFDGYYNFDSIRVYKENEINCFKTGDIGVMKENYIYCKGRVDNQIKYNGYRIELEEIENAITKLPMVKGAVVLPIMESKKVKYLKAFVETDYDDVDLVFMKEQLKEYLPSYMIPRKIVFLDKFPMNKNEKYDRKKLVEYV